MSGEKKREIERWKRGAKEQPKGRDRERRWGWEEKKEINFSFE